MHIYFISVLEKVCYVLLKAEGGSAKVINMASGKGATNAVCDELTEEAKVRDFNLF